MVAPKRHEVAAAGGFPGIQIMLPQLEDDDTPDGSRPRCAWPAGPPRATIVPMDPELKTLLAALVEGQVKLAERMEASHAKLAARMDALAATQNELAGDVRVLVRAQERTERRLEQVIERLDRFGEQVVRGFTKAGEQHGEHEGRIGRLEQAVFGAQPPAAPR
ncbi:MAG: hypothetical protein HY744_30570 [Deltaproteobacteria bacterium]|nr:hypothetical protein [Deltaproteobacteria bacterium]